MVPASIDTCSEKVVSNGEKNFIQIDELKENAKKKKNILKETPDSNLTKEMGEIEKRIKSGLAINIVCDFCEGPIHGKPNILKFANIERFFCCTSCKTCFRNQW